MVGGGTGEAVVIRRLFNPSGNKVVGRQGFGEERYSIEPHTHIKQILLDQIGTKGLKETRNLSNCLLAW